MKFAAVAVHAVIFKMIKGVCNMQVTVKEFVDFPALYLEKADVESVYITKDGQTIAVLAKPSSSPITDSLLGLLKDTGLKSNDDIKSMKVGI